MCVDGETQSKYSLLDDRDTQKRYKMLNKHDQIHLGSITLSENNKEKEIVFNQQIPRVTPLLYHVHKTIFSHH